LMKMGLATVFHPRTRGWGKARDAIEEYVAERHAADARALHLDMQGAE
jgi:heterodisulfide reductase subunit C